MKPVKTEYTPAGHYSPAIEACGLIFISGQLSIDPATGKIPQGGIIPETEQALENISTVLKAAGLEKESIVQCRIYTSDVAYWDDINKVYAAFFGVHKPARAVVPCGGLHNGCLVEIEAVAER